MWILPYNTDNQRTLKSVAKEIESNEGDAFIMEASFLDQLDEQGIIQLFNKARDEEYIEVIEKCEDFFKEIEKETARKNFSFAEVEENEEELEKLISWASKVNSRDIFISSLRRTSNEKLDKCKKLLDEFSSKVYESIDKKQGE
jgi:vacuolar-type H+-ATPase subunit I/STV1